MSTDGDAQSLIEFLYRTPLGLVQANLSGAVELMNPMAAQLLMPLARDGSLDNLFTTLEGVAPQLRMWVAEKEGLTGTVCDNLRLTIPPDPRRKQAPPVVSLSILKQSADRLMVVLADVTSDVKRERESVTRRLHDAARLDALTQMPNRTALLERIQHAIDRSQEDSQYHFAVLVMNCDRLRQINNSLGPAVGDAVLGHISSRLRSSLRLQDPVAELDGDAGMAARLGGDEFAVMVMLDAMGGADDVHAVAQRLVDMLGKPYAVGDQQLHCGVSIGVVLLPQATPTAFGMLRDGSVAMTEAKRAGGGRYVVFEPWMRERAERRADIESRLRETLARRDLFVVYQPVVGLQLHGFDPQRTQHTASSGAVDISAGMEALVRWRDPELGDVPPQEFIAVAEECGLIDELGTYVLREACTQFMAWRDSLGARAPRKLAVNLSRAQLSDPALVETVRDILAATGMPARALQLEVTESVAAQGPDVQNRLHELKSLGLTLALDDFGTGYSSLSSLHLLPVDTVKIDRSFVSQADSSAHHRVLVEATIKVAQSLGMDTVAEGIETASQAAVCVELGCDKGQGYLFGKPMSAAEFALWMVPGQA